MFITFRCEAYENISYFSAIAKQLLHLMNHSGAVPGAFKWEQIPDVLSQLYNKLGLEKGKPPLFSHAHDEEGESEISLAKRAMPLIHMLEAASQKQCDVLWEESKSPR